MRFGVDPHDGEIEEQGVGSLAVLLYQLAVATEVEVVVVLAMCCEKSFEKGSVCGVGTVFDEEHERRSATIAKPLNGKRGGGRISEQSAEEGGVVSGVEGAEFLLRQLIVDGFPTIQSFDGLLGRMGDIEGQLVEIKVEAPLLSIALVVGTEEHDVLFRGEVVEKDAGIVGNQRISSCEVLVQIATVGKLFDMAKRRVVD